MSSTIRRATKSLAIPQYKGYGLSDRGEILNNFFADLEDAIAEDKFGMSFMASENYSLPETIDGVLVLRRIRNMLRQPASPQNLPARNQDRAVGYYPKIGSVSGAAISPSNPAVLDVPNAGTGSTLTVEPFLCPLIDPTAHSIIWVARVINAGQVAIYGLFTGSGRGLYIYKATSNHKITWAYDGLSNLLQSTAGHQGKWHWGMATYSAPRGRSLWINGVQEAVNAASTAAANVLEYQLFSSGNGGGGMNGKFFYGLQVNVDLSEPGYASFRTAIHTMVTAHVTLGS